MRLADVWAGKETARHVLVLVEGLGEGSRTAAAIRGGDRYRGWNVERYLLTFTANMLQNLIWMQANQGLKPHQQSAQPAPIPTPDNPNPQPKGKGGTLADFVRTAFATAARMRRQQRQLGDEPKG